MLLGKLKTTLLSDIRKGEGMGDSIENSIIEKLLRLKEYYKEVRKNTYCRKTETDDCDICRADHYLEARLDTVDKCIQILEESCYR